MRKHVYSSQTGFFPFVRCVFLMFWGASMSLQAAGDTEELFWTLRDVYEWRWWYLLPLTIAFVAYAFRLLRKKRKIFFVWLLIFPLFLGPLDIAATYSGWQYRMILRQRYARISPSGNVYSIEQMPSHIKTEYARHDYHPRLRDIKVKIIWNILALPLLYAIGVLLWRLHWTNMTDDKM